MTDETDWQPLPPELDEPAARLLADCQSIGDAESAAAAIAALRDDPDGDVYGWVEAETLVAVYSLRKTGLSFELPWLAVDPAWRQKRYGRSALVDALRRCGRKPMTVQADDSLKGWFESIGFRVVGRNRGPDGTKRYRLGWYAPRLPQEAGYGSH